MESNKKTFAELKKRFQAEINRLNAQNNELKGKLDNSKNQSKKLLGEARIEIKGLADKIDSLNRETEIERKSHKLETKNLQILIEESKEELETKKSRIGDLKKQLKESETNHKKLQGQHQDLRNELTNLEQANKELSNSYFQKKLELSQHKRGSEELFESFRKSLFFLGEKFGGLQIDLNSAKAERDAYLTELNELDQDFSGLDRLLAHKNTKLSQEISKTDDLSQELTNEEELVDLKDRRIDNLTDTIQAQTQKLNRLTKSGQQKRKTIDRLTIQLGQDQTKNKQLVADNKSLSELLTEREKEVGQLTNHLNNTQQKLKRKNNNLRRLAGKLTYYADQDNKLRGTIQDLQQEINNHVCSTPPPLSYLPILSFNSLTGTAYLSY